MTTYTIGEPTEVPPIRHSSAKWQSLFTEMDSRLRDLGDLAIPVHFNTRREAKNCSFSLRGGRNPSDRQCDHYPLLVGTVRGDTVFFWLKKEEGE